MLVTLLSCFLISDLQRRGIDLLKRITREPWWNKMYKPTVSDCLSQILKLLPTGAGILQTSMLNYLTQINAYVTLMVLPLINGKSNVVMC